MKQPKGERNLKIVAYTISLLFAILILYPLVYIISNALKDNVKIYELPPKLVPDISKTTTIVMDYDAYDDLSNEELLDLIKQDQILSMFSYIYEFKEHSIFEVKFVGMKDDKPIYYARAHKLKLELEREFGIYANSVIKRDVLLHGDKYIRVAEKLGYEFEPNGLDRQVELDTLGQNALSTQASNFLNEVYNVNGSFRGSTLEGKISLLLENFIYYFQMPSYAYNQNEVVSKYSLFVFIFNTLIVLAWAIFTQIILCSLSAFPISRMLSPKVAKYVLFFFVATMMIPFASIMLPQFTMFKSMGFYNNYKALLLPYLLPFGFYVYLFKGFFDQLPSSLFEAAQIDGASSWYCYTKICMPLSKPIISIIALQVFLSNWNDFFWAWMVTENQNLWTLNVALYNLSNNGATKQNFIMGISVITIIPVLLLTVLFSKQIKDSIASSGIKG